jgi:hypothetical protein
MAILAQFVSGVDPTDPCLSAAIEQELAGNSHGNVESK